MRIAKFTIVVNASEDICKTCLRATNCPFYEARIEVDEVEDCSEYRNEVDHD